MPYAVPTPWIQAPDEVGAYAQGARLGLAQQELQARATQFEQQRLQEQQRLEIEAEYKKQALAFQKQELDQASKLNEMKIQDAARQSQARMQFQAAVDSGADPMEAFKKFGPGMMESASGLGTFYAQMAHQKALQQKLAQKPQWVEGDEETGMPGYVVDADGNIHFPPATRPAADPGKFIDTQKHASLQRDINKLDDEINTKVYKGKDLEAAKVRLEAKKAELSALEARYGKGVAPASGASSTSTTVQPGAFKVISVRPSGSPAPAPSVTQVSPAATSSPAPAPYPNVFNTPAPVQPQASVPGKRGALMSWLTGEGETPTAEQRAPGVFMEGVSSAVKALAPEAKSGKWTEETAERARKIHEENMKNPPLTLSDIARFLNPRTPAGGDDWTNAIKAAEEAKRKQMEAEFEFQMSSQ